MLSFVYCFCHIFLRQVSVCYVRIKYKMGAQASACEVHRYCPLVVSDFDRKRDRSITCILISQSKIL